jgi:hypothetical protein
MPNTYGNSGNRWWVGWNHAQGDLAKFPSLSGPSGYESFPSGSAADDAAIAAAGTGGTVSLHNITWTIMGGPYASQAQANAAIPAIQKASPAPGALAQAAQTTGWTHNVEQWLVRGFEMLLGAALIVVGLAKLASGTPAGKAALKIGKAAAIL